MKKITEVALLMCVGGCLCACSPQVLFEVQEGSSAMLWHGEHPYRSSAGLMVDGWCLGDVLPAGEYCRSFAGEGEHAFYAVSTTPHRWNNLQYFEPSETARITITENSINIEHE